MPKSTWKTFGLDHRNLWVVSNSFPHILTGLLLLGQQLPDSGDVVICEHGNRRVTRMDTNGTKTVLATHINVSVQLHRINAWLMSILQQAHEASPSLMWITSKSYVRTTHRMSVLCVERV